MRKVTLAGMVTAVIAGAAGAATMLSTGSGPASAVADGADAGPAQFPYAVKITATDIPKPDGSTYDSACSASLISPEWIVTAGHCFHDVDKNPVSGPPQYKTTATIGASDLSSPKAVTVDVVDVRQSSVNDIALAKLSKPVTGVKTLQLATKPPKKGDQLTLAGWGATNETHPVPSTQLRYGKVDVSSTTDTTVLVHGSWPHPDMSACTYDSGAPYFSGNTLVSVESTGPGCPHTGDETTSRVDIQTDWIKQEIGG